MAPDEGVSAEGLKGLLPDDAGEVDGGDEFYARAAKEGRKGAKGHLESARTIATVVGELAHKRTQKWAQKNTKRTEEHSHKYAPQGASCGRLGASELLGHHRWQEVVEQRYAHRQDGPKDQIGGAKHCPLPMAQQNAEIDNGDSRQHRNHTANYSNKGANERQNLHPFHRKIILRVLQIYEFTIK